MDEHWKEIIKKILAQSLLVIVGFSLFVYMVMRVQKVQGELIVEKDKRIQFFYEMMMSEREEKMGMYEGLLMKSEKQFQERLEEQKEHYEKMLDFYEVQIDKIGYIEKQYQK